MTWISGFLRITTSAILAILALSGCGGVSHMKAKTASDRGARPVPAFRVGQYCQPSQALRYGFAGLVCTHHHLARH
jgi:hypothetical protein